MDNENNIPLRRKINLTKQMWEKSDDRIMYPINSLNNEIIKDTNYEPNPNNNFKYIVNSKNELLSNSLRESML